VTLRQLPEAVLAWIFMALYWHKWAALQKPKFIQPTG
jgi:hypothetical protein